MLNNIKIIAVVLLSLAVVLGGYYFYQGYQQADQLGDELRTEFMSECVGGSATEKYCACVYKALDDNMTNAEFLEFGILALEDESAAMRLVMPYVLDCL